MPNAPGEPGCRPLDELVCSEVDAVVEEQRVYATCWTDLPSPLQHDLRQDLTDRATRELLHPLAVRVAELREEGTSPTGHGPWREARNLSRDGLVGLLGEERRPGIDRVRQLLRRRARSLTVALERLLGDSEQLRGLGWRLDGLGELRLADTDSDPHVDQSSVLEFRNGRGHRVVYKPRSLAPDLLFASLVEAIESEAHRPLARLPAAFDRGSHGWNEAICYAPLRSDDDRTRYLERLGQLIGLCWVLRVTDLHAENLISVGPWPVPVDVETVWQPRPHDAGDQTLGSGVDRFSVLDTHLLPDVQGRERLRWDTSGVLGRPRAFTDAPELTAEHAGEDRFITSWTAQRLPDFQIHTDVFRDERDIAQMSRGFQSAVTAALAADRAVRGLLDQAGPRLERRVIVRDTGTYRLLLSRARSDRFTRSEQAYREAVSPPPEASGAGTAAVPPLELQALALGEVPRLTVPLHGGCLSNGRMARQIRFTSPRFDSIQLQGQRQQERALTRTAMLLGADRLGKLAVDKTQTQPVPESASSVALVAGLLERQRGSGLLPEEPDGPWYGLDVDHGPNLRRLPSGLHRGVLGTCVLLSAWSVVGTADRGWARRLVTAALARWRDGHAPDTVMTDGLLDGTAGALWAIATIRRIDPSLVGQDTVDHTVAVLLEHIEGRRDTAAYDLATGRSGELLALACATDDGNALKVVAARANRLLDNLQATDWACDDRGAAHGLIGVLAALVQFSRFDSALRERLDACVGRLPGIMDGAVAKLDQSPAGQRPIAPPPAAEPNGWCRGPAGIIAACQDLSRLQNQQKRFTLYAEAALEPLEAMHGGNDRLCCGRAGIVEILATLTRRGDSVLHESALGRAVKLLQREAAVLRERVQTSALQLEPTSASWSQVLLPGLLRGTAGPCYTLLRLEHPRLPPVLPLGIEP